MKPIIFKQSDISKIYELELNNYNKWFIAVDGNNYLTQNGNAKIIYKVYITKTEEPLQKINQDYELEQKINNVCDEFLNKLMDFNIFEVVDDYKKFVVNKDYEFIIGHNMSCVEPDNKYEALEWYLYQARIKANDIYRNYIPSKSKTKTHYNICIEIEKISDLYSYNDENKFKIRDLILDQIMILPGIGFWDFKLAKLYKTKEEVIDNLRISEIIDNITFKINDLEYQYEDVTNDKFVYKFLNKYEDLIFIKLDDGILKTNEYLSTKSCIIYKSKTYPVKQLDVNGKKYLYIEPIDEFKLFNSKYNKVDLNVRQGQEIIDILRFKFSYRHTWKYAYFNDVVLSKLHIDTRIETALKLLYEKHIKSGRILDYGIWTYDRRLEHRVNIYDIEHRGQLDY